MIVCMGYYIYDYIYHIDTFGKVMRYHTRLDCSEKHIQGRANELIRNIHRDGITQKQN